MSCLTFTRVSQNEEILSWHSMAGNITISFLFWSEYYQLYLVNEWWYEMI